MHALKGPALIAERLPRSLKCCWSPTVRVAFLVTVWYLLGTVLSFYNKSLVGKDSKVFSEAFPAPLLMSGIQFFMQHLLARSMFLTGLVHRAAEGRSWSEWFKNVFPNGTCTGLDIGFSNMSLVFISLSFYTMCKATVPLFLLAFAFIWGIERPTWRLGLVVLIITIGLILLVSGEAQFDAAGFCLVMVAACCSGLRFTLTQVFLHGHHDSVSMGGPLEILEALTPVMSLTMLVLSLVWERLWVTLPASAFFLDFPNTLLTLCLIFTGALLAFLLVWTEYQLIKETSALTFMIAGTLKEIVTVLAAVIILGDAFGWVNAVGLGVVISGVALFNMYKLQKQKKDGALVGLTAAGSSAQARREGHELEMARAGSADPEAQPLVCGGESPPPGPEDGAEARSPRLGGGAGTTPSPRVGAAKSNGHVHGAYAKLSSFAEPEKEAGSYRDVLGGRRSSQS